MISGISTDKQIFGDLISYPNDRKGSAAIAGKAESA
jgi:hypothetical protein